MIREVRQSDVDAICEIYNHYVLNTVVSFEEQAVAAEEMRKRIEEVRAAKLPWLIFENEGRVLGYAYASAWKSRCAYRHSVESTVYLRPDAVGRGHGSLLYAELLARLRDAKLHTAIGGIALPNPGSVALHEKLGFEKIAHFKEVGSKFGRWIDVGYWQLRL